jgi:hypothetical protein
LRREDINKKGISTFAPCLGNKFSSTTHIVLGQRTRAFNMIFSMAQQKLRNAFGMELVELPSRAGMEQDAFAPSQTQAQTQDPTLAIGIKKRG